MPSSTHQAKRPYAGSYANSQTAITSYFHASATTTSGEKTSENRLRENNQLPSTVQANLLSVGMRVRKSVPEGYKTGTYSAFGLFSEESAPREVKLRRQKIHRSVQGGRELTPYCGILKVGGFAQQEYSEGSSDEDQVPGEDELPYLSSQGSTISNVSTFSIPTHKRRFIDEEDEDDMVNKDEFDLVQILQDDGTSTIREPNFDTAHNVEDRTIVMPKSRRKHNGFGKANDTYKLGPENPMDFEEAEFLDYSVLGIGEVEMKDM